MTLLEKLAPYLPYGLEIQDTSTNKVFCKLCIKNSSWILDVAINKNNLFKPILRPLSDLSNNYMKSWCEILDEFSPREYSAFEERFNSLLNPLSKFDFLTVNQYKVLIKNNFDVFGMIESGEAIDINTLSND